MCMIKLDSFYPMELEKGERIRMIYSYDVDGEIADMFAIIYEDGGWNVFNADENKYTDSYNDIPKDILDILVKKTEIALKEYNVLQSKLDMVKQICEENGYEYVITDDNKVIMDNGNGTEDGEPVLEWTGNSFTGHYEYRTVELMLRDWNE